MSALPPRPTPAGLRPEARRNLRGTVITIEMTLISVLVGVNLFPLMESATPLLRTLRFEYWPYILASLLLIMWIWSGVISHSLTFVSWPIDIGHYLFYIFGALLVGIQMHFLTDPTGWFGLLVAELAGILGVYYYDLRLIRRSMSEATGSEAALLAAASRRQVGGLRLVLLFFVFAIIGAVLVLLAPATMLGERLHVLLGLVSVGWLLFMLVDSIRSFNNLREPILSMPQRSCT